LPGSIFYVSKAVTDEIIEAVVECYSSPEPNVELMQKATDLTYEEAVIIPVYQGGMSHAIRPYLKDTGLTIRGSFPMYWNPEEAWLDK